MAAEDLLSTSGASFAGLSQAEQTAALKALDKQTIRASVYWTPGDSEQEAMHIGRVIKL